MSYYQIKKGMDPGSVLYTGKQKIQEISIENYVYSQDNCEFEIINSADDIKFQNQDNKTQLLLITGLHDISIVEKVGNAFGIHNLALEDILNTQQRPKAEFYDDNVLIVLKNLNFKSSGAEIEQEHISIVLGKNYVVCFAEKDNNIFYPVTEKLKKHGTRIRSLGSDYLAYSLMDVIIDNYFILLEKLDEHLDFYETKIINGEDKNILNRIYKFKREVFVLNNSVWPLRELISHLERSETQILKKKNLLYFRDLYDHTIQVIERAGVLRDLLTALLELHLSRTGNRTNDVMKVLTIISTIFIPLTFIAGLYGMNFHYMPELQIKWAYFAVLGIMMIIVIGMLLWFRKKKWI
jgi:magnesium transporter